jgi:hypothetical protein
MKNAVGKSEASSLHQKAEELLTKKKIKATSYHSEAEMLKRIYALEDGRTKLLLINKKLKPGKEYRIKTRVCILTDYPCVQYMQKSFKEGTDNFFNKNRIIRK